MPLITGIVNPGQAVAGEDLSGDQFALAGGQVVIKIDPASTVTATSSAAGLKLIAPAAATVVDNANGTMTVSANAANTQAAIRPIDELAVMAKVTAADKFAVFDTATSTHQALTVAQLLKDLRGERAVAELVKNAPGGVVPATVLVEGVAVPTDTYVDYNGSWAPLVTLPVPAYNGQRFAYNHLANLDAAVATTNTWMTGNLPINAANGGAEWVAVGGKWSLTTPGPAAAAGGPTTNAVAWTKAGGLVDTVNGVVATQAIPVATAALMTDSIGYNATGAPVTVPITREVRIKETYAAASAITYAAAPTVTNPYFNDYTVTTLIEATAAGTVALTTPPAALSSGLIGVEFDIKATGAFAGNVTLAAQAPALIDGAATHVFAKTATIQPSRSVRWTGSNWLIV